MLAMSSQTGINVIKLFSRSMCLMQNKFESLFLKSLDARPIFQIEVCLLHMSARLLASIKMLDSHETLARNELINFLCPTISTMTLRITALIIMIFSMMSLIIKCLYVTQTITDILHSNALHHAECQNAECQFFIVMLSVNMLTAMAHHHQ
jgi:hypothetical protein